MERKNTDNKKRIMNACASVVLTIALLFAVYETFKPQPEEGVKTVTVTVNHADGSALERSYETEAAYLGEALLSDGLIAGEKGDYGLFVTTVDGETADAAKQQWWCLTKNNGETVETGVDTTPLADGDRYELTLKTAW